MARSRELFVSVDVEADGDVPGLSSMLSFGAAAFTLDKKLLGTFSRNLLELPGASPTPDVSEFWRQNPEAWAAARKDPVAPEIALPEFASWLGEMRKGHDRPVFVGYPAAYDWMWTNWYSVRFLGVRLFKHSDVLDAKSYAASHLGGRLRDGSSGRMPREWKDDLPHTHVAEDDAVEQGALIVNMMRAVRGLPRIEGVVRA